ncbi:MAG: PadR family transcriptional regulator [Clostridia bacterium]|nr:PadR family transcriptional regulator [Clostridia bacterium]
MTESALTEAVYYILLSLLTPMHGYGIMQNAETLSGGRVRLAAGTLYGALSTLVAKGWIENVPDGDAGRQKKYRITRLGREVLEGEWQRLGELYENGRKLLKGEDGTL